MKIFIPRLCRSKNVINSRPVSPLFTDFDDLTPLTPVHFLIQDKLTAISNFMHSTPSTKLKVYQQIQELQRYLWERWSKEFISELQQRTCCKTTSFTSLSPGDMVVFKEDNKPPLNL
ncbi:hypothetical protein Trydic_g18761 [Trypoxylus dichotomus]